MKCTRKHEWKDEDGRALSVIDNGEVDGGKSKEDERGRFTKMRISGVVGPLDGRRSGGDADRGMRRCKPVGWERGGEDGGLGPEIEYEALWRG